MFFGPHVFIHDDTVSDRIFRTDLLISTAVKIHKHLSGTGDKNR
jgi:hypothetical protein